MTTDLDTATFTAFRDLIYQVSGITLADNKRVLVRSRIGKRMRMLGLIEPVEYLHRVERDHSGVEIGELIDAISTNVTSFFREPRHFELLGGVLRDRSPGGRLRIWSAASSTGEEPYSIAMTLCDAGADRWGDARILASDLNQQVLETAMAGRYADEVVSALEQSYRRRFFQRHGDAWRVDDRLRQLITFRRLNLSKPPFPMRGPFDMIFCRNVMIYFDRQVRSRLLQALVQLLAPDGLLFVGHAESLTGFDLPLTTVQPTVYRRR